MNCQSFDFFIKNRGIIFFLALPLPIIYIARQLLANSLSIHADEIILNYWSWKCDWQQLFNFLPTGKHDDRPIGWLAINMLYELFGVNYRAQISAMIIIHYVNAILLFKFSDILFGKKYIAMIVAIVFSLNFPANSAYLDIGAIFDLLCCAFMIVSIYYYYLSLNRQNYIGHIMLSAMFFYLSLRSKEMTLLLPIVLILLELIFKYNTVNILNRETIVKNIPFMMISCISVAIFFAHGRIGDGVQATPTSPYYIDFSFTTFFVLLNHYISQLSWIPETKYPVVIFIFLLALGIVIRHRILVWASLSMIMVLLPVLFYKNHVFDIFLYVPNVFFSIMCGCFVDISYNKINTIYSRFIVLTITLVLLSLTFNSSIFDNYIDSSIKNRKSIGLLVIFLEKRLNHIKEYTRVYIANVPNYYIRQGKSWPLENILALFYRNDTLSAYTNDNYDQLYNDYLKDEGSKIFLRYNNNGYVVVSDSDAQAVW